MTVAVKTFTIARRREGVTHSQLVEYWRGTHAANVVAHMKPDGYTLTFFDPRDATSGFDGMAELRYLDAARAQGVTGRNIPEVVSGDGWADLVALPTTWLRVTEHVIVAGPGPAAHAAATTPAATQAEREAAFKLTFLISARDGFEPEAVKRHWLDVHVPNFRQNFVAAGGVRYVVNVTERATGEDLVGVGELSYRDRASAQAHTVADDGFKAMVVLRALPSRECIITE